MSVSYESMFLFIFIYYYFIIIYLFCYISTTTEKVMVTAKHVYWYSEKKLFTNMINKL